MSNGLLDACAWRLDNRNPVVRLQSMLEESGDHRQPDRLRARRLAPGEYCRARSRDGAAERAVRHGGVAHRAKSGDQRLTLRLDDHVLERIADQVQVPGVAAGDEPGQVRGLPDEV